MIKINGNEFKIVATPNMPVGHVGVTYQASHMLSPIGSLIDLESAGLRKFFVSWACDDDIAEVPHADKVIFVNGNHGVDLEIDEDIKRKPEPQPIVKVVPGPQPTVKTVVVKEEVGKIPFTITEGGRRVVVCESLVEDDNVFPDYSVRMSDQTRAAYGLSWSGIWKINGIPYEVKPALQADLDRITDQMLKDRVVFMNASAIKDGKITPYSPPEWEEPTDDQDEARSYITGVLGEELAKDVETDIFPYPKYVCARMYHKTISKGIATGADIKAALDEALRRSLREELILTRNRINETIDKIHPA